MYFGERLRLLREEKNITQKVLANKLNITSQALSQYELKKRMPDTDMIIRLADYFDVSLDYLLGRSDIRKPEICKTDTKIKKNYISYNCVDTSGLCREDVDKVKEYIDLLKQKYTNKTWL